MYSHHSTFLVVYVFFFKQKTAYEMRISDWSSDVCSSDLIALTSVAVDFAWEEDGISVRAAAATTGPTGVEMEALTAASVALLTLYDMAKALDRAMLIGDIRLLEKSGGRSEEHTSELQSLMRISYAVFCLKKTQQH